MSRKPLTTEERAAYEAGGFRFDPPAHPRADETLDQLESAIRALQCWTRRPKEIRAALAIRSPQALARWRAGDEAIPHDVRERTAVVLALRRRLTEAIDFVMVKPLPDLKLRGRPAIPGRPLLAGGQLSELLALLLQLVLAEEAAARRKSVRRRSQ